MSKKVKGNENTLLIMPGSGCKVQHARDIINVVVEVVSECVVVSVGQFSVGEVEEGPAPPVGRRVEAADVVPEGLPGEGGVLGHGGGDGGV